MRHCNLVERKSLRGLFDQWIVHCRFTNLTRRPRVVEMLVWLAGWVLSKCMFGPRPTLIEMRNWSAGWVSSKCTFGSWATCRQNAHLSRMLVIVEIRVWPLGCLSSKYAFCSWAMHHQNTRLITWYASCESWHSDGSATRSFNQCWRNSLFGHGWHVVVWPQCNSHFSNSQHATRGVSLA